MKFAVMQPYIFPYLGYYQLVKAVDYFVFYDDVTFIKGGYINRNSILSNGTSQRFTIPVPGLSSNILINKLFFANETKKTLRSIQQSYSKSPYFSEVFPLVEMVINDQNRSVHNICAKSISEVFNYLGIKKQFLFSSDLEYDKNLSAADKLIAMSSIVNSKSYVNTIGGKALYSKDYFKDKGVDLSFIEIMPHSYNQKQASFTSHLSMIDVLMWNSKEEAQELLNKYRLI